MPVVLLDGVEHAYWDVDEQVLRTALHLLNDPSAFVCGQSIVVDGGHIVCLTKKET